MSTPFLIFFSLCRTRVKITKFSPLVLCKLLLLYYFSLCSIIYSQYFERIITVEPTNKLISSLNTAIFGGTLKKLVLSRPSDKTVIRTEGRIYNKEGIILQLETFRTDGKALHKNLPASEAPEYVASLLGEYRQLNLITTGGDLEARLSSKGKLLVSGKIGKGETVELSHDRVKQVFLHDGEVYPFLIALGVSDEKGRVFDKKRAKFRQIDRFLHYIDDIYPKLPQGELYVLDLCCGKSYLTFAAYWFLTEVKKREVKMVGADLKQDVIEYCSRVASKVGFDGLSFVCCDINKFEPERRPNLVLSLHACDIATDIVLTNAARLGAEVILSTPCCQHEINSQLSNKSDLGKALSPVLEHSLIKQKLAVALTDALRCKRLEASGYSVDVTELIDPENTPKNLLIRAVRTQMSERRREAARKEFDALCAAFGISLFGANGANTDAPTRIIYNKEEK